MTCARNPVAHKTFFREFEVHERVHASDRLLLQSIYFSPINFQLVMSSL